MSSKYYNPDLATEMLCEGNFEGLSQEVTKPDPPATFEQYWDSKGCRIYADTHEERARITWNAQREIQRYWDQRSRKLC